MKRVLLLLPLLALCVSSASAQTLYVDEQFGLAQTSSIVFDMWGTGPSCPASESIARFPSISQKLWMEPPR